jgi:hypothetical protein
MRLYSWGTKKKQKKTPKKKKQEPTATMNGWKIKQEQNSLLLST